MIGAETEVHFGGACIGCVAWGEIEIMADEEIKAPGRKKKASDKNAAAADSQDVAEEMIDDEETDNAETETDAVPVAQPESPVEQKTTHSPKKASAHEEPAKPAPSAMVKPPAVKGKLRPIRIRLVPRRRRR